MKISEAVLLDTNILVYAHNSESVFHKQSLGLIKSAVEQDINAFLTYQNLLEFFSIITDKRRVEKPLSSTQAKEILANYLNSSIQILYPTEETFKIMIGLISKKVISNGKIFDAFLAATMKSHNILSIITANIKDFKEFSGIKVIDLKSF